ncbi:hypothetical protein LEM8419_00269 [Neolewinella maritima]|uniref:NodB homology domain-containing protein n=1 Tax=Neolewinella maritima TaxID=1383882 RepID=A0ABM9AW94_9BACT|nr:polysaccharide deacetylase family protein [Neolewinella maritima]CAH0998974.1 hypothetical protein LEM8419_00269 [Neolewinella maritima]
MSRLIISLDFELHWGVFDHVALDEAGRNYFLRTRELVHTLLDRFQQKDIHATWATVGLLFARTKADILATLPDELPAYRNQALNPYALLDDIGRDEDEDPYHYAASLIERILATPGQALGSHTYSHYYCLEPGQDGTAFAADLAAAQRIAERMFGTRLTSLVYPRNQYVPAYAAALTDNRFRSYRTNPNVWFWQAESAESTGLLQKAARLADHYVSLDQQSSFSAPQVLAQQPVDIPASRFLRPYLPKIDGFGGQSLKIRRICHELTAAARSGRDYHLWWHPHNMATDPHKNFAALDHILDHFAAVRQQYGMQSVSMEELASTNAPH